jgi:hypothetical protein
MTCPAFFGQWSGNGPVSYYYPQMLSGAGISSNNTQLLLQGVQNIVQFIGAVFGALITDRVGRRPQLLTSTSIIVFLFVIITALNATNVTVDEAGGGGVVAKSGVTARAQIAMIFIFGFVYSAGWTPNQAMYPVECLRYESRAKGMAMNNVCPTRSNPPLLFSLPPLTNNCLSLCRLVLHQHRLLLQHLCHRNRLHARRLEVLLPLHLLVHVRGRRHLLPLCGNEQAHPRGVDRHLPAEAARPGQSG